MGQERPRRLGVQLLLARLDHGRIDEPVLPLERAPRGDPREQERDHVDDREDQRELEQTDGGEAEHEWMITCDVIT
jgi:hypothetical protein